MLIIVGCVTKFNEFATTTEKRIDLMRISDMNTKFSRSPNKQPDYLHSASKSVQLQTSRLQSISIFLDRLQSVC